MAPAFEGDCAQAAGEFCFERVWVDIAHGMEERAHLALARANDGGIGMASGSDAERSGEIEVLAPVRVPNFRAARALPDDGPGLIRFDEEQIAAFPAAELLEDSAAVWALDARLDGELHRKIKLLWLRRAR